MRRRKRAWFRTDLLAVAAVVLLVLWLPMYLAQDEVEREAQRIDGWKIPAPREGDRVVMDLVVTWADGRQVVLPEAYEITYRSAIPGEIPREAVYAQERVTTGINITEEWVSVLAGPASETLFFGDDGHPVYSTNAGSYIGSGDVPIELESQQRRVLPSGVRDPFAKEFRHHDTKLMAAGATGFSTGDVVHGHRVGHYGDHLIFAGDGEHIEGESFFGINFDHCSGGAGGWLTTMWFGVKLKVPGGHCIGVGWDWYVPDLHIPVGRHFPVWTAEWKDGSASVPRPELVDYLGSIDFLPSVIERGAGRSFPVAPSSDPFEGDLSRDTPEETTGPRIRLGDLEEREAPLLLGSSLADIAGLLDHPDAPHEVRALREDGAQVVGFKWWIGDPVEEEELDALPLIGDLDPTDPDDRYPVHWEFLIYSSPEQWTRVQLGVTMGPDGTVELHDITDMCDGIYRCEKVELSTLDMTELHLPPDRFLPEIRARLGDQDAEGPAVYYWSAASTGYRPYPNPDIGRDVVGSFPSWRDSLRPSVAGGLVAWQEHHGPDEEGWEVFGGFNTADGTEVSEVRWREIGTSPPVPSPSAASDVVRVIEPIPPLLFVAIVLFLLSLIARAIRFLLNGGQYGLMAVGYAKISRSRLLDQERRQQIMDRLESQPGLTGTQVQQRLGFGWGATIHHLETLVKADLLVPLQNGRRRHYFPQGGISPAERLQIAAAQDTDAARLLDALRERPGSTARELTDLIVRSRTGISRTASRLERMGLIEKRRDGTRIRFHPVG